MPSELRRGLVRIVSSYGRLGLSLAIGLIQTRLLLGWLGVDAFGLICFVGSSVGLALLIDEVLRSSMIKELATAHHADREGSTGQFASVLACGTVISMAGTVLTAMLFLGIALLVPIFDIPAELHRAAFWLIVAEGMHSCVMVITAPIYNMFVVTERFFADNIFTTLRKASYLIVAWLLSTVLGVTDISVGVIWYGFLSVAANIVILLAASGWMVTQDRRLRPRPRTATKEGIRQFLGTFGWNTSMMVAVNGYDRVGQLITNFALGTVGNAVFATGYQLAAYVRMVSLGVNFGTDAVAARIASTSGDEHRAAMIQFTSTMTRLHAFAAFPVAALLACLTGPIMMLWVGDRMSPSHLPMAIATAQILLLPVTVRSVTDCWTRILYGAGYIRRYAPLLLAGGLLNPVVAGVLLWTLPMPERAYSTAISFAAVFTLFHLFLLPVVAARCLGCQFRTMLLPVLRPALATILPAPVLVWGLDRVLPHVGNSLLIGLPVVAAIYGAMYLGLSLIFVLKPEEKARFTSAITRRLRSA